MKTYSLKKGDRGHPGRPGRRRLRRRRRLAASSAAAVSWPWTWAPPATAAADGCAAGAARLPGRAADCWRRCCWRAYARKSFAEFLAPGLYHYYNSDKFGARRLHLRVEKDGRAILMVDAYRVVHLNATAAAMVKYFLDDFPQKESRRRLAAAFRISKAKAGRDYREVLEKIDLLVNRADVCPVSYFGIDKIEAFQTPVSAPYRMDLALTYRCNIDCSHCYNQRRESAELATGEWKKIMRILWEHGVPHFDFTGGEPTLRDDLVELVTFAEDLGAITGLLTNGVRLADEDYVAQAEAGRPGLRAGHPGVGARRRSTTAWCGQRRLPPSPCRGSATPSAPGIHVLTNTTITRANIDGIEEIVPFLKGLGVGSFAVNSIIKRRTVAPRGPRA